MSAFVLIRIAGINDGEALHYVIVLAIHQVAHLFGGTCNTSTVNLTSLTTDDDTLVHTVSGEIHLSDSGLAPLTMGKQ